MRPASTSRQPRPGRILYLASPSRKGLKRTPCARSTAERPRERHARGRARMRRTCSRARERTQPAAWVQSLSARREARRAPPLRPEAWITAARAPSAGPPARHEKATRHHECDPRRPLRRLERARTQCWLNPQAPITAERARTPSESSAARRVWRATRAIGDVRARCRSERCSCPPSCRSRQPPAAWNEPRRRCALGTQRRDVRDARGLLARSRSGPATSSGARSVELARSVVRDPAQKASARTQKSQRDCWRAPKPPSPPIGRVSRLRRARSPDLGTG